MGIEQITKIIELAKEAAKGNDNFKEGAVGSNGYGFVFRDADLNPSPNNRYIFSVDSDKLCGAGAYRDFTKKLGHSTSQKIETVHNITHGKINPADLLRYEHDLDLLLAGSIKTLVPTLQFGGYECVFDVWMFVVTSEGQMFPATFYWGKSGLSVGGWTSYGMSCFLKERIFPEDFVKLINFTPFEFTDEGLNLFLDALEFALKKVPVSDFWGVSLMDAGYFYMGIKEGKPFDYHLNPYEDYLGLDSEAEKELKLLINKEFKDDLGDFFFIHRLPGLRLYYIEFEYPINFGTGENKTFGYASYILDLYKKILKAKRKKEEERKKK